MIENECNKTQGLGWLCKNWLAALAKKSPECFYWKHTYKSGDGVHAC